VERGLLAQWLEQDIGDTTYPFNAIRRPVDADADADQRIAEFIAHFAPDLPPSLLGRPADAATLAAMFARIADRPPESETKPRDRVYGRSGTRSSRSSAPVPEQRSAVTAKEMAVLHALTEPLLRALAKHHCRNHPGCSETGCEVLAQFGPGRIEALAALEGLDKKIAATDRATSRAFGVAHTRTTRSSEINVAERVQRTKARVQQVLLTPDTRSDIARSVAELPNVGRSPWWQALHEDMQTATGPTRLALQVALLDFADLAAEEHARESAHQAETLERRRLQDRAMLTYPAYVLVILGSAVPSVGMVGALRADDTPGNEAAFLLLLGHLLAAWVALLWCHRASIGMASIRGAYAAALVIAGLLFVWVNAYPRFVYQDWNWLMYIPWAVLAVGIGFGAFVSLESAIEVRAGVAGRRAAEEANGTQKPTPADR
jgi:hypothetical protein